jgi:hypothetical protein
VWGAAFEAFGGGEEGKRACRAIGALAAVGQIDATITNFLVPLQVRRACLSAYEELDRLRMLLQLIKRSYWFAGSVD